MNDKNIETKTKCKSYTDNINAYIISATDINNSVDKEKNSYLYPGSINWLANSANKNEAYAYYHWFFTTLDTFKTFDKDVNLGISPKLTI